MCVCAYTVYSVYNGERNKSPFKRDDDDSTMTLNFISEFNHTWLFISILTHLLIIYIYIIVNIRRMCEYEWEREREGVGVWEEGEWVQSGTYATTSRRGHRDIRLRVDDGVINYYYNAASTVNLYNIGTTLYIYSYIRTTKIYVITNNNIFSIRLALFFLSYKPFFTRITHAPTVCTFDRSVRHGAARCGRL